MVIFSVQIFGDDALDFCSWSKEQQKEWIKKYTNQKSDTVIDEFLSNPMRNDDGVCMNCGTLNNVIVRHDNNISKTDVIEVAANSTRILDKEPSEGNSVKRPKGTKRRKS